MILLSSKSFSLRNYQWLFLSLIGNLVIHLFFGLIYHNPVDFVLQFEAAKEIAQGKLLYRDIGEIEINGDLLPRPQYPPLYLYTLGLLISLIGVDTFTWQMAKVFLIAMNLAVGVLIYSIVLNYVHPHPRSQLIALVALNWFLINPSTLGIILGGYHENFMLLFVLLGIIFLRKSHYFLSGFCFGLSLLVKPIAGVYMLPLLIWGFYTHDLKSFIVWICAGLTFLAGSLPFLLLSPEAYLNDVFFIHTQRPDPSMSFYTYFFTEISMTIIPFIIQLALFGLYILVYVSKIPIMNTKQLINAILPFMTIFMAFNRILYPHYIPFFFPFFTYTLFILFADHYSPNKTKKGDLTIVGLLCGLLLVYIGSGVWSILWAVERYETYLSNPLFLISTVLCMIGLIVISIFSIFSSNLLNQEQKETTT
ncbi:MAG: DUF2029 domain-containing protein [Candidatus Heimdallarchaeota archaeon]|nr:MAG: DUF2029 domain-containing protein [Candidatus Heimdallarchaeota archaeon]